MSPLTVMKSDASEGLIEREAPTTAYPVLRKLSATPAPMPCEAPVTMTTLRGKLELPAREVSPVAVGSRMESSSDEIDLVDHPSGLTASDADEYAFVEPVEAGGSGLDLG